VSLVVNDVAGVVVGEAIQMQAENLGWLYYLFLFCKVYGYPWDLVGARVA
jgi:hypothetical protein